MTPKVFVIDKENKTCLPTHPARARKLLNSGKADVYSVIPFTIKLRRIIDNPVGSFSIGVDDGAKEVGIAVINEVTKETIFCGTIRLRNDVCRKILQRRQYRRSRRTRKLRHRKARFLNRKQQTPFPSIRQRKESIIRVISDLMKRINITDVVVEQGEFDMRNLSKTSEYSQINFRAKVLWRDNYSCQNCASKNNLQAHHILPKLKGGTDTPQNGITLCNSCHSTLHNGKWILTRKPKAFKYPMHLMQGKHYLVELLKNIGLKIDICFGYTTSKYRKQIGLLKTHINDAISMVTKNHLPKLCSLEYVILPRRSKTWDSNPTKKADEKFGFRHFDLVKAKHRTKGNVIGSIRSLKEKALTLRTKFDDNFPVSYNKSNLLYRFNRLMYLY